MLIDAVKEFLEHFDYAPVYTGKYMIDIEAVKKLRGAVKKSDIG